jgi:hypothetical protein
MAKQRMTIADFAKRCGVTTTTISNAIKTGRIVNGVSIGPTGRVQVCDPDLALAEWEANSDIQKKLVTRAKKSKSPSLAEYVTPLPDFDDNNAPPDARIENSWLARYRKELTHLELQTKQGLLIDKAEMQKDLFKVFREVRDSLLNIPSKIAPEVCAMDDPFEVQKFIEKQIRESLEALVKYAVEKGVVDEP